MEPMVTEPSGNGEERTPTFVIRPPQGWVGLGLGELRAYRDLLYFLIWRDVKVRYKQTVLGAAWAVLQPLLLTVVFSVFLGHFANVSSLGYPYPLFTYVALVPWTLFSSSVSGASSSLVGNSNLVSKVYFPRLILPIAAAGGFLVDFAIAFCILLVMMAAYHVPPTVHVLWLPVFLLLTMVSAYGVGLWLAAANVKYRDVHHAVPFLMQVWLFATPVAYSATVVPTRFQWIYGLNPMAGVIEGFRWAMLGPYEHAGSPVSQPPSPAANLVAVSAAVAVLVLVTGIAYFRRAEHHFADVI
jgi:lipopolysaccharide transport system permease protein